MEASAGRYLKAVRIRLGLGVREVQEASAVIASEQGNPRFYVAASRLAQIENEQSAPGMFKLFSLSAIYGLSIHHILRKYGIDPNKARAYRDRFLSEVTRPAIAEVYGFEDTVRLPARLDPCFRWETTQLVNEMLARWGEVPAAFLIDHNPHRHVYGYVGSGDRAMFPLIRPGSLLMIDPDRRRVARNCWKDEFERPIYFLELRSGYRCAWCQVEGSRLVVISHPHSGEPVGSFSLEHEAEIVGQVVGVATRLVPASKPTPEAAPKPARPIETEKEPGAATKVSILAEPSRRRARALATGARSGLRPPAPPESAPAIPCKRP